MTICTQAMTEIGETKNNVWSYHDRPGKAIAVAALLSTFAFFPVVLIFQRSSYAEFFALPLVVLLSLFLTVRSTSVEIDRTASMVKKVQQLMFFKRTKFYPLLDFERVSLREKVVSAEEGYKVILCSVILEGKELSVELFSTDDEKEGRALHRELSTFLNLSGRS